MTVSMPTHWHLAQSQPRLTTLVTRLINLAVVARCLGYSPRYVQRIAADQGRPPSERKYPEATHERFPPFVKDGNRKGYFVTEQTLAAFFRRRGRVWEPPL